MEIVIVVRIIWKCSCFFPYLLLLQCLQEDTKCKDHRLNLPAKDFACCRGRRMVLPVLSSFPPCLLYDLGVWTKCRCKCIPMCLLPLAWVPPGAAGDNVSVFLQGWDWGCCAASNSAGTQQSCPILWLSQTAWHWYQTDVKFWTVRPPVWVI